VSNGFLIFLQTLDGDCSF